MSTKRDSKGRFVKDDKPMTDTATDTAETVRNYIVPISSLFLWPIHLGAWLVATVVRAAALVLLVAALVALYGWWAGDGSQSCPVAPAPAAYQPAISA